MSGEVLAVALSPSHSFSKAPQPSIHLLAGLGVQGDAHAGVPVQHLYKVRKNPQAPNLTQVHLLQSELFLELAQQGIALSPGEMGENITTVDIDLLALPEATHLHLGERAVVELTGLRTPCTQMDKLRPGLMKACTLRGPRGQVIRKAGIMGIVLADGEVKPGDSLRIVLPPGVPRPLRPV